MPPLVIVEQAPASEPTTPRRHSLTALDDLSTPHASQSTSQHSSDSDSRLERGLSSALKLTVLLQASANVETKPLLSKRRQTVPSFPEAQKRRRLDLDLMCRPPTPFPPSPKTPENSRPLPDSGGGGSDRARPNREFRNSLPVGQALPSARIEHGMGNREGSVLSSFIIARSRVQGFISSALSSMPASQSGAVGVVLMEDARELENSMQSLEMAIMAWESRAFLRAVQRSRHLVATQLESTWRMWLDE